MKRGRGKKAFLALLPAGAVLLTHLSVNADDKQDTSYKIRTDRNIILLETPWGTRTFFGDPGFSRLRNYRFDIPIKDLKPKPTPKAPPPPSDEAEGDGSDTESHPPQPNQAKKPSALSGTQALNSNNDYLIVKANELYNKGRYSESLNFVEELLQREPKNTRAWLMKGSLLQSLGHEDLAQKSYQQALELDPSNADIQRALERYKK